MNLKIFLVQNFKDDNPYFSTRQIVKTYTINEDISFVTPIDWKKRRVRPSTSVLFFSINFNFRFHFVYF